jgi:hypothetical protein
MTETNAQVHRRHIEEVRIAMQEADPAIKRLERLHRQILRRHVWSYSGYSLNIPNKGDVLMHFDTDIGRKSVRINIFGHVYWDRTTCRTFSEAVEAA